MDVARALGFTLPLTSLLVLSACGLDLTTPSAGGVNKDTKPPGCASAEIPGQYIVHWEDGSRSVEKSTHSERLAAKLSAQKNKQIRFIEPDYRVSVLGSEAVSTSSTADRSWGQSAIGAPSVWPTANGSGVVVAVIDTGVDIQHPQLKNQFATNAAEIPGNGIDDDHNGKIDDVIGWDFVNNKPSDPDPPDHGSHVAGIIAADHTDGPYNIKGVAPGARILPLSFITKDGSGSVGHAIEAMEYAVARGAKIVNASWGGEFCSRSLEAAVAGLSNQGILFVVAAGNGFANIGYNLDDRKAYPAAYNSDSQITVAAMTSTFLMTGFSNYSRNLVHIMAPGNEIWSTVPGGYKELQGTSMAAPFVSGAAAVIWSHRPKANYAQVKSALLNSVTPGSFPVVTSGYLNLSKALQEIENLVQP